MIQYLGKTSLITLPLTGSQAEGLRINAKPKLHDLKPHQNFGPHCIYRHSFSSWYATSEQVSGGIFR